MFGFFLFSIFGIYLNGKEKTRYSPDKKVVQLAMAMLISNGRSRLRSKVGSVVQHYKVVREEYQVDRHKG